MHFRKGNVLDIKKLYVLLNSAKELQMDHSVGVVTYPKEWVHDVLAHPKSNLVIIADDNNKIAGFLIAHVLADIKMCILNDLYVSPKFRKKGVGSSLLQQYEAFIKKRKFTFSSAFVHENNSTMHKFMDKHNHKHGAIVKIRYKEYEPF